MTNTIFALMLVFTPPNMDPVGVPLARDLDFIACQIERDAYLTADPETPGIVVCLDQETLDLLPLSEETANG